MGWLAGSLTSSSTLWLTLERLCRSLKISLFRGIVRALLTPEIVPRLGVVLFKPGRELMRLFSAGRVLVEAEPQNMARLPSGRVPDARQPLADDPTLHVFFSDERVIRAAGGFPALERWLKYQHKSCQYPHSGYHHAELVTMRHPRVRCLCAGTATIICVTRRPLSFRRWR